MVKFSKIIFLLRFTTVKILHIAVSLYLVVSRANFCRGPITRNFKRFGILMKALSYTIRISDLSHGPLGHATSVVNAIYTNALHTPEVTSRRWKKNERCQKSVIDPDTLTFHPGVKFSIYHHVFRRVSLQVAPARLGRVVPSRAPLYAHTCMHLYVLRFLLIRPACSRPNIFTLYAGTHYEHLSIFVIATRVSIILTFLQMWPRRSASKIVDERKKTVFSLYNDNYACVNLIYKFALFD